MIIPAIDLIDGQTVRLYQGSYDQTTQYSQTPFELRDIYAKAGAGVLHLVDLSGAKDASKRQLTLLKQLMDNAQLPIQVGGGVRSEQDVIDLLAAGASRVVIGSLAIREPVLVQQWLRVYGGDRIVLALDVAINAQGEKTLPSHGWIEASNITLEQVLDGFIAAGARHVLCTDISRDGAMGGPNLDLYRELVRRHPTISVQASGGVSSLEDLKNLNQTGVASAISGKALLEGSFTITEAVDALS